MKSKKREQQKNKTKVKCRNNNAIKIYNFDEYYDKLYNQIKDFKRKNLKKESNKILKTSYLTRYIKSLDYCLQNSKINFLWSQHTFLNQFLSELEFYPELEAPAKKIVEILCGNFSNSRKIKKMAKFLKDYENESNIYLNQKLCSFYSIQLPSNNNKKILFSICLQNDENSNPRTASAYIYFLSYTEEWNFEKKALDFINNYILKDDEKFPLVGFDKSGYFMTQELLFSEKKKESDIEICFPLKNIKTEKRTIFKTEIINKKIHYLYNKAEDFIISELNKSIISQVENDEYEDIIKEAINGRFWKDIQLSNQEKDKIFPSTPFIISGRPGTGKTTVILVKLFAIYYNFYLKKEKREEHYKTKYNNNYNITDEKIFTSQLRVVFTSYSQDLCKEQMKSFVQMVKNVNSLAYKGIKETEMKKISSFRDVISYPIFVNFRKIMFMIDGSLTFQFFKRKELRIYENIDDSVFYYDEEKVYECNNYFILNDKNFKNNLINFFYSSPELDKINPIIQLKESNENTFCKFFNKYKNNGTNLAKKLLELNLNPIEVYAQYISIIKGSFSSHLYSTNCITLEDYKKKGKKITDSLCLEVVYEICMEYENFKRKSGYFDIQDLTNFLIRQVLIEFNDDIKLIDYIFIDEIQDLTASQIFLLILVSKYCKIYAGDTCQTISKFNRFRFSELYNILYNIKKILPLFDDVINANLNLNYRLNSKIMHLSTYMAYLIRECFPNTLDNFQDDFSLKVTEIKPMLINDIDSIYKIFNDENTNLVKNLTLSSLHCFICRDKKTKLELSKLKVMPKTIEECKGLEYDIVIVYNFFSSSQFYDLWEKLFRDNLEESTKNYNTSFLELEHILESEDLNILIKSLGLYQFYENNNEDEIKDKIINELICMKYPSLKCEFDIHKYFDFCSELKQFYVIITRPRTFLLFYEKKNISYFSFFRRMIKNGIITDLGHNDNILNNIINNNAINYEHNNINNESKNVDVNNNDNNTIYNFKKKDINIDIVDNKKEKIFIDSGDKNKNNNKKKENDINCESNDNINCNNNINNNDIKNNQIKNNHKIIFNKNNYIDEIMNYYQRNEMLCTNKNQMKALGDRKFIEEKYEDAAYFYGKAGEEDHQKKAKIFLNYNLIKEEKRNKKMSWSDFMELNFEILNNINDLKNRPDIFKDEDNIEAFCYLNLEKYQKSIELFIKREMYNEAGDVYFDKLSDYENAFDNYKKIFNIPKAIKSLAYSRKKGHYIRLFEYINEPNISYKLGLLEYYNYYKKYIHNLFKSCYSIKIYISNILYDNNNDKKIEIFENNDNDNETNEEEENQEKKEDSNQIEVEDYPEDINTNENITNEKKEEKYRNKIDKRKDIKQRINKNNTKTLLKQIENEDYEEEEYERNTDYNEYRKEKEFNEIKDEDKINEEKTIIKNIDKNKETQLNLYIEDDFNTDIFYEKKEILNFVRTEIINKIFENINDFIYYSNSKSLSVKNKIELFVYDIINKAFKKYQNKLDIEYLGEGEVQVDEINNKLGINQEEENLINENFSNKKIIELEEKKIDFKNIENEFNSIDNFDKNDFYFYSFEKEKLNEIIKINHLKNKSKTYKELIRDIILNYYNNINLLESKKDNEDKNLYKDEYNIMQFYNYNNIYLTNYIINQFKEEFRLSNSENYFIECYYNNKKLFILKEIIKCMPEIYYFKSKAITKSSTNFKEIIKFLQEKNYMIYDNIIYVTKNIIYKTDIIKKDMNNFFYNLFYLNNFYDISEVFQKDSNESIYNNNNNILLNLTLNNIKEIILQEKNKEIMNFNNIIYYLNYKLRYGFTIFIKTGKVIFDKEKPFITYKFKRLIKLIREIKNKNYIKYNKINLDDINKLREYIISNSNNNMIINNDNIENLMELYDITSFISLYLFQLYVDNHQTNSNFDNLKENDLKYLHNTLFSLYKFSLLFNESNCSISIQKKLLIFSLFNIFCICPIPNLPIFNLYESCNCCLLNKNSILFSQFLEGTYLDIFSENNDFIYAQNRKIMTIFDSNGNNILISNDILYQVFMLLLSKYLNITYEKNKSILQIPKDPFNLNYKYSSKETFFFEIIYYLNILNYKIIINERNISNEEEQDIYISSDKFKKSLLDKCLDAFNGFKTYYPYNYDVNNLHFSLYNYLIGFFFNPINSPQVLLLFIQEYNDLISKDEFSKRKICYNEIYILFNFIKIYFSKINLNQYKNNLIFENLEIYNNKNNNLDINYSELLDIFEVIQKNKYCLIVSILFLRRLLPYILYIISNLSKIETNIYFFDNESIFDNGIKILKIKLYDEKVKTIVSEYLKCLKQIMSIFSLNGKKYSTFFKNIKVPKHINFVNNMNYVFYNKAKKEINNINANYQKSFDILNHAYNKMYYKIKIDYNWNFHFYELLFHCFYLTFLDFSIQFNNQINDNKNSISNSVDEFLEYYEMNDYYLNFINKDGAMINISKNIVMNSYDNNINYKKFDEKHNLRNKLIQLCKYEYMSKKGKREIELGKVSNRNYLLLEDKDIFDNDDDKEINIIFKNYNKKNNLFSNIIMILIKI